MPDRRRHRGPAPQDRALFGKHQLARLRCAVADLSWLDTRGYSRSAAVELVGNRYQLRARQRVAVGRSACGDAARDHRRSHAAARGELEGAEVHVDGYNQLTTIEAALAGGVVLEGRDGFLRDMASMHGTFRSVEETDAAIDLMAAALEARGVARVVLLLDAPIANSGRLAGRIRQRVASGVEWSVELEDAVDARLRESRAIVATADAGILDAPCRTYALAADVVARDVPAPWLLRLAEDDFGASDDPVPTPGRRPTT